jgi:hypothetical protein
VSATAIREQFLDRIQNHASICAWLAEWRISNHELLAVNLRVDGLWNERGNFKAKKGVVKERPRENLDVRRRCHSVSSERKLLCIS